MIYITIKEVLWWVSLIISFNFIPTTTPIREAIATLRARVKSKLRFSKVPLIIL